MGLLAFAILDPSPAGELKILGKLGKWLGKYKFVQFIFDKRKKQIYTIGVSILFPGRKALRTIEMHPRYLRLKRFFDKKWWKDVFPHSHFSRIDVPMPHHDDPHVKWRKWFEEWIRQNRKH